MSQKITSNFTFDGVKFVIVCFKLLMNDSYQKLLTDFS